MSEYVLENDGQHYVNGLLGFQYIFENNINLIVEYVYREDGYSDEEVQKTA